MASCSFMSSLLPPNPPRPFAPSASRRRCRTSGVGIPGTTRVPLGMVASASRRGGDDVGGAESGGWLVDEGMVVLRRRLREMQMAERNYEPPEDWAEWEKPHYASYGAGVYRLTGMVQVALMGTRPSVALGVLALLALSVPTSAAVALFGLADAVKILWWLFLATIVYWAHHGPPQSGRQTWPHHKAPRRSKDGFEDPCSVPADRYQRDPAIASEHHPACSNRGPSFRIESARYQVPSSGCDYRTAGLPHLIGYLLGTFPPRRS
ncbi:hypothetical protein Taro_041429 [Colocasia esculenta]|uniref:Uncharacterized protein n=1 Tax=Colocasia esculenta TaxID=4460 RepID=A0A843WX99_COLES|nr:hypothetical protein [Colocasia esculenta]